MQFIKYKTNSYGSSKQFAGFTRNGWIALASIPIFLFIVLPIFFSMFRVVGVGQVGIVTRFGQVVGEDQSGFHLILPWPFEGMTQMDIKTQKEQQDASAATKDLQNVATTVALNYHLTSKTAREVYQNVGVDYPTIIIDPVIQEAVKSITSQYTAGDLISQRPVVEAALNDRLVSKLTDRGITVDNISITNFQFSQVFGTAIEEKQAAQQEAQKAQYQLQTAQLQAQAQDVQAKTLTPEYLQLKAIERWDGHMPSAVGGNSIFSIPIK